MVIQKNDNIMDAKLVSKSEAEDQQIVDST